MNKVLTFVGGISKNSLNQKLFNAIKELEIKDFEFEQYDISKLPYYSQDFEHNPEEIVKEMKKKVQNAPIILFISPEYNRSFPGVLKNAIDWCSRPYGENLWAKKTAGVLGASSGNIGTFGAQHHLRQVLSYLDMNVLNQPEFYFNGSKAFDEEGRLTNSKTKELLQDYFTALALYHSEFSEINEIVQEDFFEQPQIQ